MSRRDRGFGIGSTIEFFLILGIGMIGAIIDLFLFIYCFIRVSGG